MTLSAWLAQKWFEDRGSHSFTRANSEGASNAEVTGHQLDLVAMQCDASLIFDVECLICFTPAKSYLD
jgi:hypothetical protein